MPKRKRLNNISWVISNLSEEDKMFNNYTRWYPEFNEEQIQILVEQYFRPEY